MSKVHKHKCKKTMCDEETLTPGTEFGWDDLANYLKGWIMACTQNAEYFWIITTS